MNTTKHVIGFVPLARPTFDMALAAEMAGQARHHLTTAGLDVCGPADLVTNLEGADAAAEALAAHPIDLLVVFQATFADSTMAMRLAARVEAPLVLWAVPEARDGGRLRLNALCGINLAGHALKRAGRRYEYVYAPPDDARATAQIGMLARAGRARRLLRGARIGRVGENPDGFESCLWDPEGLKRRFGVDVVQMDLARVFAEARSVPGEEVDTVMRELAGRLDGLDELDGEAMRRTLRVFAALRQLAARQGLHGLAVRCWPEFFTEMGCAACGAMSMLSDALVPCSCEADVNGTITQFILQAISGEPAFGADLVAFDAEEDCAVLWHCGLAPLSMADPSARPRGTVHSNRQLPLLMEFPLKPGRVTLARLSEATGAYRLVVGSGQMLAAPLSFSGTSGVLRFDRPAVEALDTMMTEGLEHHLSLTYGDYAPALVALAAWLEIPVLHLA